MPSISKWNKKVTVSIPIEQGTLMKLDEIAKSKGDYRAVLIRKILTEWVGNNYPKVGAADNHENKYESQ